jgi:hypothetical protein
LQCADESGEPLLRLALQLLGVGTLDALGDVVEGEDAEEVDLDGHEPVITRLRQCGTVRFLSVSPTHK